MKKVEAIITNDYKQTRSLKKFNCKMFIAKYQQPTPFYRLFIDREDGRRVGIILSEDQMNDFAELVNNSIQ